MRPLNLGETLDASIKIVRARWKTLATVMIAIALPVQLASIVIISATTDVYQAGSGFGTGSSQTTYSDSGAYAAGQVAVIALMILSYLLGTVACFRAVAQTYLGRPTSARETLRYALDRLSATLWLTIVLVVGLLVAFVAFVLPAIWLAVAWTVAIPVMLVEGTGGIGALKRSFRLTEGRWWATFGRVVVANILVYVVTTVAAIVFLLPAIAVVDDTSFAALVLEHAGNLVASLLATPFLAAVITLVYFDLRVRKEGFDVTRLDDAPAPGAEPAPAAAVAPPSPAPGSWAPPVAPEPERPSHDG